MRTLLKKQNILAGLICLLMAISLLPLSAKAAGGETVRVGWHEPPYFITDEQGRRSGYSYEYLQKLSAYTGWKYEYVEGSWSELLEMLRNGEIDLMSNVSYTEERAEEMLFAASPMGTEAYYVFTSPEEREIRAEDESTLDGKRVGVARGSIQSGLFRQWAESHGVKAELVEMSGSEEESLALLGSEIDAFVSMDVQSDPERAVPVWKIGSSDFFFAVSLERSDLLAELNAAMGRIQDENKYFGQQLDAAYLRSSDTSRYLTAEERDWLSTHGAIRVGYQDGYLAFCAKDENGELIGALKDYLDYAAQGMENANIRFETVAYPTAAAALEALQSGWVDCVFPANLSAYDGEEMGLVLTPALMRTEMDAVVRAAEQKDFFRKEKITVAVNQGNTNYELFLRDNFPDWEIGYFVDTPAGLVAVADGQADCVIISNYRFNNISQQCQKLRLTTVYSGVEMDYCLAVRRGDKELYSILAKTTDVVPDSVIHAALMYYSTEDVKVDFMDLVKENLPAVVLSALVLVLIFIQLFHRSRRAEKKVAEEERLVKDLHRRVFVDPLTSVRNKGAYTQHLQELQDRLEQGEELSFAVGVFDCDDLKKVNDMYGHDKGDEYLKTAAGLICRVFAHSPVFRIGGDEFAVVMQGEDLQNKEELTERYRRERRLSEASRERWAQARVTMGIAVYDSEIDHSVYDTARRADKVMYERKRARKAVR